MQGSYFSGRINVERIGEQCYLGHCNSQKGKVDVRWDGHSSEGPDDQQVEGSYYFKEAI